MSDPLLTQTEQERYSYHLKGLWESSFNLNEAPGRLHKKKRAGDNYIFEFLGILGNTPRIVRVLMLRSNELEACPRPPNLIRHLI